MKIHFWFWLVLVPLGLLSAQKKHKRIENALLWEISGNGLKESSYVFGTIHLIPTKDFHLSELTILSLEKSSKIVFEIDLEEMNDLSSLFPLLLNSFMPENKISDFVSSDDYSLIENYFQNKGLPMVLLERVKPMFLNALLSGDLFSEATSYELRLMEIATRLGKKTGGLETIEFQLSLFDRIPYEQQAKLLVHSIKKSQNNSDDFAELIQLYKQEDIEKLVQLVMQDSKEFGSFDEIMIYQRNENWIPKMTSLMQKEPVFFAVGAGHLGGNQGVIQLLRNAGYTLKPLKNNSK
jgi:uncharacterized protein